MQERGPVGPALSQQAAVAGRRQARLLLLVGAVAAAIVGLDQLTKTIAVGALADGPVHVLWTLRLNLSFNSGAAFSLGPGLTPFITAMGVALVVTLLLVSRRVATVAMAIALGLVLGGALGNLVDRLFRSNGGAVIDFIDLQWWPVFNVADAAISCGAVLLAALSFFGKDQ